MAVETDAAGNLKPSKEEVYGAYRRHRRGRHVAGKIAGEAGVQERLLWARDHLDLMLDAASVQGVSLPVRQTTKPVHPCERPSNECKICACVVATRTYIRGKKSTTI